MSKDGPEKTESDEPATPAAKRKRNRSPNYPIIPLAKAVERASTLYQKNKTLYVPLKVACDAWDYKLGSSVADQNIAAIRAFGLIETRGQGSAREIRVSDVGRRIVLNATDRDALLKKMALGPSIHRELFESYRQGASDELLRNNLLFRESGVFNDAVVDGVIDRFKQSIQFAKLETSDIIDGYEDVKKDGADGGVHADLSPSVVKPTELVERKAMSGTKQDVFTLDEGQVVLQWPAAITEAGFADLKDWIQLALRKIGRSVKTQQQEQKPANDKPDPS